MDHGDRAVLAGLQARLDAQEREVIALRATLASVASPSPVAPAIPASAVGDGGAVRSRATTRRGVLKGAGALVFTTALLATGAVVPITPYQVAAADPLPRPSGSSGAALPTTTDTLYKGYVGSDFLPEITSQGLAAHFAGGVPGAGAVQSVTASAANFSVRLDLPQGATVTEVIFYVVHNDANFMNVTYAPYGIANGSFTPFSSASVTTISSSVQAVTLTPKAVVDNAQYSHVIEWIPTVAGATHQLYGARVGYTLPGAAQVYAAATAGIGVNALSATGTALNAGSGTGPAINAGSGGNHGISGTTTAAHYAGVVGYTSTAMTVAVGGIAYDPAAYAAFFTGATAVSGPFTVYGGPKNAAVKHPGDGTYRLLYCMESPESWFEDFGKGTLVADKAEITLDADFAALVHLDEYHVFLTAHGPQQLYVPQQSPTGFTVMAIGATPAGGAKSGEGGGTFSWRVVAKRKDIVGERLAKVPPPPSLKPITPFTVPETPTPKPPATKP